MIIRLFRRFFCRRRTPPLAASPREPFQPEPWHYDYDRQAQVEVI